MIQPALGEKITVRNRTDRHLSQHPQPENLKIQCAQRSILLRNRIEKHQIHGIVHADIRTTERLPDTSAEQTPPQFSFQIILIHVKHPTVL